MINNLISVIHLPMILNT